jgi:hypothetical protein
MSLKRELLSYQASLASYGYSQLKRFSRLVEFGKLGEKPGVSFHRAHRGGIKSALCTLKEKIPWCATLKN